MAKTRRQETKTFLALLVLLAITILAGGCRQPPVIERSATPTVSLAASPLLALSPSPTPTFKPFTTPSLSPYPSPSPTASPTRLPTQRRPLPVHAKRFGNGRITAVAYSPDGHLIGVVSLYGLYLFDAASLHRVHVWETPPLVGIEFSQDGNHIMGITRQGEVFLWTMGDETPQKLASLLPVAEDVQHNWALAPDREGAAIVDAKHQIQVLWQGQVLTPIVRQGEIPRRLVFAPNNPILAVLWGNHITFYHLPDEKEWLLLDLFLEDNDILFSPDGRYLFGNGPDLQAWRLDASMQRAEEAWETNLPSEADLVTGPLFVSPRNAWVARGMMGGDLEFFTVRNGDSITTFKAKCPGDLHTGAVSADGHNVVLVPSDARACVVDIRRGRIKGMFSTFLSYPVAGFSSDGRIVTAESWGDVMLWNAQTGKVEKHLSLKACRYNSWGVALPASGEIVALNCDAWISPAVYVFSLKHPAAPQTVVKVEGFVALAYAIFPDGRSLLVSDASNLYRVSLPSGDIMLSVRDGSFPQEN